jgi:hypothetical protein
VPAAGIFLFSETYSLKRTVTHRDPRLTIFEPQHGGPPDPDSTLDTARIVRDGVLLSFAGSAYLILLLRYNCRLFLRHYPRELRKIVRKHPMNTTSPQGVDGRIVVA